MHDRAIVLHCLHEAWPREVSMVGERLVARIVDDALQGRRTVLISPPKGGDKFDFSPYINEIINAAVLITAVVQLTVSIIGLNRQPSSHPTSTVDSESSEDVSGNDNLDTPNSEAEVVAILKAYLIDEKEVAPDKADKLATAIVGILRDA